MAVSEVVDVTIAEVAADAYLDDTARGMGPALALSARVVRQYARIAYRAARAEQLDPEPELAPCRVCRGVRVCDLTAHGALRMTYYDASGERG